VQYRENSVQYRENSVQYRENSVQYRENNVHNCETLRKSANFARTAQLLTAKQAPGQ
jgi:hypothetical protein